MCSHPRPCHQLRYQSRSCSLKPISRHLGCPRKRCRRTDLEDRSQSSGSCPAGQPVLSGAGAVISGSTYGFWDGIRSPPDDNYFVTHQRTALPTPEFETDRFRILAAVSHCWCVRGIGGNHSGIRRHIGHLRRRSARHSYHCPYSDTSSCREDCLASRTFWFRQSLQDDQTGLTSSAHASARFGSLTCLVFRHYSISRRNQWVGRGGLESVIGQCLLIRSSPVNAPVRRV